MPGRRCAIGACCRGARNLAGGGRLPVRHPVQQIEQTVAVQWARVDDVQVVAAAACEHAEVRKHWNAGTVLRAGKQVVPDIVQRFAIVARQRSV